MYSKTCIKRPLSNGEHILQYFRPSLGYHLSLRSLFCLFLNGPFIQDLLYMYFCFFADVVVLLQSVSNQVWAVPSRDPGVPYRAIYGSAITGISSQVTLHVTLHATVNFPNTTSCLPKSPRQTAQTQIRLQSNQSLPCLL